jgi:hypothetical protein
MVESAPSGKFECLPDPLKDRICSTLPCPPNKPISSKYLFPYTGIHINYAQTFNLHIGADSSKPDWIILRDFLLNEGFVSKEHLMILARACIDTMSKSY